MRIGQYTVNTTLDKATSISSPVFFERRSSANFFKVFRYMKFESMFGDKTDSYLRMCVLVFPSYSCLYTKNQRSFCLDANVAVVCYSFFSVTAGSIVQKSLRELICATSKCMLVKVGTITPQHTFKIGLLNAKKAPRVLADVRVFFPTR